KDPGALCVDDLFKTIWRSGRSQAVAEVERPNVRDKQIRVGHFFFEPVAIALEPGANSAIRRLLAVRKEQGHVIGACFINPLVAITGPSHNISPPLMSNFVKGNEFAEVLLALAAESDFLLSGLGQKGISREIEQTWPALAEASRDLRNG